MILHVDQQLGLWYVIIKIYYLASVTGIKTIDIGAAQWGMHSIRETAGVVDGYYMQNLFVEFFKSYEKLNHKLLGLWNIINGFIQIISG